MSYSVRVKINDKWFNVRIDSLDSDPVIADVDGEKFQVSLASTQSNTDIDSYLVDVNSEKQNFVSPMPGVVLSILVSKGDEVHSGTKLCVIETMKIQQILRSTYNGIVTQINVKESDHIKTGESLLEISVES